VFLMPVLALGAAAVWDRVSRGAIALIAAWTFGLVVHGLAYPWRLFHIPNGENPAGEWLSKLYHTDFSRLFPSFIRMNGAAWIGAAIVILIVVHVLPKRRVDLAIPLFALALAFGFQFGRQPARRIEFEDAHVMHGSGRIYPDFYTVARVSFRGGWVLDAPDAISFLAPAGKWTLHYITGPGALIELAGRAYQLPPDVRYASIPVTVPKTGRVTLRVLTGAVNVDRMDHDGH